MSVKKGFKIEVVITRTDGNGETTKTESREVEDIHLIQDQRHPSSVLVAVTKQLLYKILEGEHGFLEKRDTPLVVAWGKRQAEIQKRKQEESG